VKLVAFFLCSLAILSNADTAGQTQASKNMCSLLSGSGEAQNISFEKVSGTDVILRLRNNSTCEITLQTDPGPLTWVIFGPKGAKIEVVTEPVDGLWVPVHYYFARANKGVEFGPGWGDSVSVYNVPAGQSLLFSVPLKYFKKHLDIAVPFNYVWERTGPNIWRSGVSHRVYFLNEDLPSGVSKRQMIKSDCSCFD
jgi:hypothetical protein